MPPLTTLDSAVGILGERDVGPIPAGLAAHDAVVVPTDKLLR